MLFLTVVGTERSGEMENRFCGIADVLCSQEIF
jgi:hypothetical protein